MAQFLDRRSYVENSSNPTVQKISREIGSETCSVAEHVILTYQTELLAFCDRGFKRSHGAALEARHFDIAAFAYEGGLVSFSTKYPSQREEFLRDLHKNNPNVCIGIVLDQAAEFVRHEHIIREIKQLIGDDNVLVTDDPGLLIIWYKRKNAETT